MDFRDKVVIVTGSSSGIGAAVALRFAELGARVVVTGRDQPRLAEVAARCQRAGRFTPLIVTADITVDADLQRLVHQTVQAFGRIDVLVNNAGTIIPGGIYDGIECYDKIMSINLRSVYLLISLALPHLIKTKGNIINMSNLAALKPKTKSSPYSISKAGLDMLTKCAALELAGHGVRVNSINSGVVKTNILKNLCENEEAIDRYVEMRAKSYPLGKIVSERDVADLTVFLASDKANSTTGATNVIDCGAMLL